MGTITWLGVEGDPSEETTAFGGMAFKKGEAVECDDARYLAIASKNKYFEVSGYDPKTAVTDLPKVPSIVGVDVQHPVAKPGEPLPVKTAEPLESQDQAEAETKPYGFAPIPPAKK